MVLVVEVGIAIFMSAPVDDGSMDRAHKKMHREQEVKPPIGCEGDVKCSIAQTEGDACHPEIAYPIQGLPGGVAVPESGLGFLFKFYIFEVDVLGPHHQTPDVLYKMGGMGVFFGIAICVMHPVEDGIAPGIQKGAALGDEGE